MNNINQNNQSTVQSEQLTTTGISTNANIFEDAESEPQPYDKISDSLNYKNENIKNKAVFINQHYYNKFNVSKAMDEYSNNNSIPEFIEVTFKNNKQQIFQNKKKLSFRNYQYVLVEVENGIDIATVTAIGKFADAKCKHHGLTKSTEFSIVRHALPDDMEKYKNNINEVKNILSTSKELVQKLDLDMKITNADWQFDHQRLTIYFTAPQRIDFRVLVKELARTFRTRIELRQISTRDEAKRIGGMGPCGRTLCCSSFASDRCHVTLEHARLQQLSNNVAKLSGYCGRLKCCLLYEYEQYVEKFEKYPSMNSEVELPEGRARIIKADIFKDIIFTFIPKSAIYKQITFDEFSKLDKQGKVFPLNDYHNHKKDFKSLLHEDQDDDIEELNKLEDKN